MRMSVLIFMSKRWTTDKRSLHSPLVLSVLSPAHSVCQLIIWLQTTFAFSMVSLYSRRTLDGGNLCYTRHSRHPSRCLATPGAVIVV